MLTYTVDENGALTPLQQMTFPDIAVKMPENKDNMGLEMKNDTSLTSMSGEDSDISGLSKDESAKTTASC